MGRSSSRTLHRLAMGCLAFPFNARPRAQFLLDTLGHTWHSGNPSHDCMALPEYKRQPFCLHSLSLFVQFGPSHLSAQHYAKSLGGCPRSSLWRDCFNYNHDCAPERADTFKVRHYSQGHQSGPVKTKRAHPGESRRKTLHRALLAECRVVLLDELIQQRALRSMTCIAPAVQRKAACANAALEQWHRAWRASLQQVGTRHTMALRLLSTGIGNLPRSIANERVCTASRRILPAEFRGLLIQDRGPPSLPLYCLAAFQVRAAAEIL